ncbi:cyclic nucleotide-binding domain-containing protein [Nonomuraea phyllanthi]|uniref:histidine kinase n=1 Tax=Nonomuraea phyllanthi TaxID=2219224 RepID=A0A5C4V7X8_9ACTN|nr:ATP-binding protein [Nonomuraea phyllanthi]KAB8187554.1 cyclic nucleotide-binding domain-containing protein [Nonomuraea phyllanthi]QFY07014.1 cyclic nucleotide-binding domain-containing protein [Nonomuraea phyllanthi]
MTEAPNNEAPNNEAPDDEAPNIDIDELRKLFLFERLDDAQLTKLAGSGRVRSFETDEIILRQGDPAECFAVLIEGEVQMLSETVSAGTVAMPRTAQPGVYGGATAAYLGDRAPQNYQHTLRATAPSRMFLLPAKKFAYIVAEWFPMAMHLLDGLMSGGRMQREAIDRRQRLTALGTITAGLTHELNNPAAAAVRAANELRTLVGTSRLQLAYLAEKGIPPEKLRTLIEWQESCTSALGHLPQRSPLEISDAEDELGTALDDLGVAEAWDLAPALVNAGFSHKDLEKIRGKVGEEHTPAAVQWLAQAIEISQMIDEVTEATERITSLIRSAKQYSQMDRAPFQQANVHDLLDSTLAIFRGKIPPGISVVTDYDRTLPPIPCYAGELNQVWTNLIHNALDAMGEEGTLTVRTAYDEDEAIVEIGDTGPGVPDSIKERIFEPFFTTKSVGQGTGLGLDISYRIVAGRHGGEIKVRSVPGDTWFEVRLPLREPTPAA